MNGLDPSANAAAPKAVREEAAAWLVRLQRADRSAETEDALRRWLDSDPSHRAVFYQATATWEALGGLDSLRRLRPRRRASPVLALAAAAAALVLVAGGGVMGWRALFPWSDYQTRLGEVQVATLEDGSRVTLNTDSQVQVRYSPLGREVRVARGEAMFEVAKNKRWPFTVHAGGRSVRALGTTFIVRTAERDLGVTLLEGRVAIARDEPFGEAPEASLSPGQRWTLATHAVAQLDAADLAAAGAWRRHEAIFEDTPLAEATAEMNRYSPVKIVLVGHVAELHVSGVFATGESRAFARTLALLYGLEVLSEGEEIRLRPPTI